MILPTALLLTNANWVTNALISHAINVKASDNAKIWWFVNTIANANDGVHSLHGVGILLKCKCFSVRAPALIDDEKNRSILLSFPTTLLKGRQSFSYIANFSELQGINYPYPFGYISFCWLSSFWDNKRSTVSLTALRKMPNNTKIAQTQMHKPNLGSSSNWPLFGWQTCK